MALLRRRIPAAALALLLGVSALAAPPGAAHTPDTTGEGAPNPTGLSGIQFYGPPNTIIATTVCPPIPDADRPWYYPTPPNAQHIGHINGVLALHATPATDYVRTNSIDLYHLEGGYSDPHMLEGPHAVTDPQFSVMMGSDGYFRAQMMTTMADDTGDDLRIVDVHDRRAYCVYGSNAHDGPYYFIHSTWGDQFGATASDTYMDLADYYVPLFTAHNPNAAPTLDYVFLVVSSFNDEPVPPMDFFANNLVNEASCISGYVPDIYPIEFNAFYVSDATYEWDFGDGSSAQGRVATHYYPDDGAYTATLTVTWHGNRYTAIHTCTVHNLPPVAGDPCRSLFFNEGVVTFFAPSIDPDGSVVAYEWDFGDGSPHDGSGPVVEHTFPHPGTYPVRLGVRDNDWNSPRPTREDTDGEATGACNIPAKPNHPPILDVLPRVSVPVGSSVDFTVSGHDPDLDVPLVLSTPGVPHGASFDPRTGAFHMSSGVAASFPDIRFRITDPGGLYDEGVAAVLFYDPSVDTDLDGVPDSADLCPTVADHAQGDLDHDGLGNACDDPLAAQEAQAPAQVPAAPLADRDLDGVADVADDCPLQANRGQEDLDGDGVGDLCDPDVDGDGVADPADSCPLVPNPRQGPCDGSPPASLADGRARAVAAPPQPASGFLASAGAPLGLGLLALVATAAVVVALLGRRMRGP